MIYTLDVILVLVGAAASAIIIIAMWNVGAERIAKTYPMTSIRIISSGSIDGRPSDE
jgi:hypothetical protein